MISFPPALWRSAGLVACLMAGLSIGCAALAKSNETPDTAAKDTAKPAAKDNTKGSAKGSAKDAGKEPAKGASKGTASAAAKDGAKKPAKDAGKDTRKDKPKPATAAASKSGSTANAPAPKSAPAVTATVRPAAPAAKPLAAPVLAPATRQHATPRKPVTPAAIAATSSTSQADKAALENVFELVGKRRQSEATDVEATISDPVARKLAEWVILRSESNGVSVERYRNFITANPSWPSQTFMRRRLEAALWDDKRDESAAWSWFENESPLSAKGRFVLARAMLARGDRANAERLVREAWR
ncbi:lytic transglycosylase, partial [Bradyrhizobium guangdongense]